MKLHGQHLFHMPHLIEVGEVGQVLGLYAEPYLVTREMQVSRIEMGCRRQFVSQRLRIDVRMEHDINDFRGRPQRTRRGRCYVQEIARPSRRRGRPGQQGAEHYP